MGNGFNNCSDCTVSMSTAITAGVLSFAYACGHIVEGCLMGFTAILGHLVLQIFDIAFDSHLFTEIITKPVSLAHFVIIGISISFIFVAFVCAIMSCVLLYVIFSGKPRTVNGWLVISGIHLCYTLLLFILIGALFEPNLYFYLYTGCDVGLGILLWVIIFSHQRRIVEESDVGGIEEASVEFTNAK